MSQENVEILRRLYEQWAIGDLSSADFFDPGVEYSRIGAVTPDMEGRWRGLDELSTAMLEYLRPFSDLRIEAERIIDLSGDRVLVLTRHTARGKQSGVPIEHEAGDLFTLRDGKIVRYDAYWNRADALEAAGLRE
jgi:ketosteroid isomerase-like protein